MTFEEFQSAAMATAIYPQRVDDFGLAYAIMGLAGEMAEAHASDEDDAGAMLDELGDCRWYVAAAIKELGVSIQGGTNDTWGFGKFDVEEARTELASAVVALARAQNLVKKFYRDGKRDPSAVEDVRLALMLAWVAIDIACFAFDETPGANIRRVLAKLSDRQARGVLGGSGGAR